MVIHVTYVRIDNYFILNYNFNKSFPIINNYKYYLKYIKHTPRIQKIFKFILTRHIFYIIRQVRMNGLQEHT